MFIELTRKDSDRKTYYNVNDIRYFERFDKYTSLQLTYGVHVVLETPEEIMKIIKKGGC